MEDVQSIRSELFEEIVGQHSMAAFYEYWGGFRSFILGRLSKAEFDGLVVKVLTAEKVYLHNKLVAAVLSNVHEPQEERFKKVKSLIARKVIRELSGNDLISSGDEGRQLEAAARADYKAIALELYKSRGDGATISQAELVNLAKAIQVRVCTSRKSVCPEDSLSVCLPACLLACLVACLPAALLCVLRVPLLPPTVRMAIS